MHVAVIPLRLELTSAATLTTESAEWVIPPSTTPSHPIAAACLRRFASISGVSCTLSDVVCSASRYATSTYGSCGGPLE